MVHPRKIIPVLPFHAMPPERLTAPPRLLSHILYSEIKSYLSGGHSTKGIKDCYGALPVTDYVLSIIFLSNYKSPPIARRLVACLSLKWRSGVVLKTNGVRDNSFISGVKSSE